MNTSSRRSEVLVLALWIMNLIVALNFRSEPIFRTWLGRLYFVLALLGIAVSGWKLLNGRQS